MRVGRVVFGALAFLVGAAAMAGDTLDADEYATIDRWLEAGRDAPRPASVEAHRGQAAVAPPITQLVAGLESRLAADPSDASGWSLLAQSYAWLGRMEDANRAAGKAIDLGVDADHLKQQLILAHTDSANGN